MAFAYDDQKRLLDLQAKSGRITVAQDQDEVEKLMSAEADHLDKMAGVFWQNHGMARAYQAKAAEVRDSIPGEVRKIGGTAKERLTLQKAVKVATSDFDAEKWAANRALHRPIGMPAPATATPTGPAISRGPDHSIPLRQPRTDEERFVYYSRLAENAPTPDEHSMWRAAAQKYAEAAREERG